MSRKSEAQERIQIALKRARTLPIDGVDKTKLMSALAWSMFYTRLLLPKMEDAWLGAINQARDSGHAEYQLRALLGFAFYLIQTGRINEAIERLVDYEKVALASRCYTMLPEGERALAWARAHIGQIEESRVVLERLAATFDRPDSRSRMAGIQVDRYIGIRCYLPFSAWLGGDVVAASAVARDAVDVAARRNHVVSLFNALGLAALPLALLDGDENALETYVAQLGMKLRETNIALWVPTYRFCEGALHVRQNRVDGVSQMRDAIDAMQRSHFTLRLGLYQGILAQILALDGEVDAAEALSDEALRRAATQGEKWCLAELLRIKAAIKNKAGRQNEARCLLSTALEESRIIGTQSFELRIANDLARMAIAADLPNDALNLLVPLESRLAGRGNVDDLKTAKDLINKSMQIRTQGNERSPEFP